MYYLNIFNKHSYEQNKNWEVRVISKYYKHDKVIVLTSIQSNNNHYDIPIHKDRDKMEFLQQNTHMYTNIR